MLYKHKLLTLRAGGKSGLVESLNSILFINFNMNSVAQKLPTIRRVAH